MEALEAQVLSQRDTVLKMARESLMQQLQDGEGETKVNEQGQVSVSHRSIPSISRVSYQALNEEGLPFVDLTEPVPDVDESAKAAPVQKFLQPFHRDERSKEDRQTWMENILDELEEEESRGGGTNIVLEHNEASQRDAIGTTQQAGRQSDIPSHAAQGRANHSRVSSADRPAPVKSVLKASQSPVTPLPKFGASGMRRGFLNLNPSSPAAEHSSDPVEQIKWEEDAMSASTSSLGSAGERMSRSVEVSSQESPSKKKKSVRIKSPEDKYRAVRGEHSGMPFSRSSHPFTDEDEGTEEEAQRIVDLLGIDVLKGHPQYEALVQSNNLQLEANQKASQAPASQVPTTPKPTSGTAIKRDVVERDSQISANTRKQASAPSNFKRGLAQARPNKAVTTQIPKAPRISQGISALERATQSDASLSKRRTEMGLSAAVPHARPSKAYAEKLAARSKGQGDNEAEDELPAKMSKVRFGEDHDGNVDVKVGTAATTSTKIDKPRTAKSGTQIHPPTNDIEEEGQVPAVHDVDMDSQAEDEEEDENMADMGLEMHDEELDSDQVEALGYLSDENDPDLGFDSDDLIEAAPNFASDGADISNEELRREYERTKAAVLQAHGIPLRRRPLEESDDEEAALREGIDLTMEDEEDAKQDSKDSKFKRERILRAMQGQRAVSQELGTGQDGPATLAQAQNMGPSMLIPSLAKVRYPKNDLQGSLPATAQDLEGDSDNDDDRLEDIMRLRLSQRDQASTAGVDHGHAPTSSHSKGVPLRRPGIDADQEEEKVEPEPPRKPSLFKSRMQRQ